MFLVVAQGQAVEGDGTAVLTTHCIQRLGIATSWRLASERVGTDAE
jgi:hypothetical protein